MANTLTAEQARALAARFRELAKSLGDRRFREWTQLTPAERRQLEDGEWTLLNASSDMITQAVGLSLEGTQASLSRILTETGKAQEAIETIATIKKAVRISGAVLVLAASVLAQNPPAVADALGELAAAVAE